MLVERIVVVVVEVEVLDIVVVVVVAAAVVVEQIHYFVDQMCFVADQIHFDLIAVVAAAAVVVVAAVGGFTLVGSTNEATEDMLARCCR